MRTSILAGLLLASTVCKGQPGVPMIGGLTAIRMHPEIKINPPNAFEFISSDPDIGILYVVNKSGKVTMNFPNVIIYGHLTAPFDTVFTFPAGYGEYEPLVRCFKYTAIDSMKNKLIDTTK